MGLTSSIYIPNGRPKFVKALINGRETKEINIDLCNVKCPVCGRAMRVCEVNEPERNLDSLCVHNSRNAICYSERGIKTDKVGLECPDCESLLYLKRTVILEYGYRIDNFNH